MSTFGSGVPQVPQKPLGQKKCYRVFFGAKPKKSKKKIFLVQIFFWARPGTKKNFFGVQIWSPRHSAYTTPIGPKSQYSISMHPKASKNKRNALKTLSVSQWRQKLLRHKSWLIFEFWVAFLKKYWNKTSYFYLKWLYKPFRCNYLLIFHRFKAARWGSNLVNALKFDESPD